MQQQPRLPLWFLVANLALITAAFLAGALLGGPRLPSLPDPQRTALQLVYKEVLDSYIEEQDEHALLERAIAGMVDGLDDYSQHIPPQKVASYDERNTGRYEGIGAKIVVHGDDVVLHFPFPDGPRTAPGCCPATCCAASTGRRSTTARRARTSSTWCAAPPTRW